MTGHDHSGEYQRVPARRSAQCFPQIMSSDTPTRQAGLRSTPFTGEVTEAQQELAESEWEPGSKELLLSSAQETLGCPDPCCLWETPVV